ncbi:hypothetical protein ACI2K4_29195 [Micromonospora sp. NPDC050397]|uniref:TIGR03943 family putative permease subunit n=1 Tax=Micromonospora sp. NPDC050397 TaxID=3364279 RepID=UPI00384D9358
MRQLRLGREPEMFGHAGLGTALGAVVSCCAADGRPIKLGLTGDPPTGLAPDTWVDVVGRYSDRIGKDQVNDEDIPYLDVESWRQIEPPKQPYE